MAANHVNIPVTLNLPTQAPLNKVMYIDSELALSNLGTNDALAYTYFKRLVVTTFNEGTSWEWRPQGTDPDGLIPGGFTYPSNVVAYGITYSDTKYNFYQVQTQGENGVRGSFWNTGTVDPTTTVGYNDQDMWLNTTSNDYFILLGGSWSLAGNLEGDAGATGPQGPQGPAGPTANLNLQKFIDPNVPGVVSAVYKLTSADNNYTLLVDSTLASMTIQLDGTQVLPNGFNVGIIHIAGVNDIFYLTINGASLYNAIGGYKSKGLYYQQYIEKNTNTNTFYLLGNTKV